LWDVKTGKEKAVFKGHEAEINRVSFSPDGRTLVSGSQDCTTRLWDVETGREKAVLNGHSHSPSNFSPDGRTLALGSRDIRLWNVETGKEKSVLKGHEFPVSSVSFSPDGRTLASASMDRTLRLLDVETGKEKAALTVFPGKVFGVSFSPDGRTLAWSGTFDKTIRLWDVSFLYDSRPIDEKIKEAETMYNLKLENLTLQPIPPERNLYGAESHPPRWPKTHPFHWRSAAESGDANAMIELGIIYDRDNELDKAWKWYTRALHAGSDRAEERITVFKQWLALHKEEYPAAYEKYISNPDPPN
jgi:dipeptidyl aminopeptidase/acylaminoacyl peptidase